MTELDVKAHQIFAVLQRGYADYAVFDEVASMIQLVIRNAQSKEITHDYMKKR
jgi:hypothetical protein